MLDFSRYYERVKIVQNEKKHVRKGEFNPAYSQLLSTADLIRTVNVLSTSHHVSKNDSHIATYKTCIISIYTPTTKNK